jgi:small-conductance mechanosensitive channel
LIAGLQMALTEPINIGDLVVIDGQSGRVEDIKTTYVVLRTWDERQIVVPTIKFLESTFQNWTRDSSELVGTVMLHLDPLAEIAPLRAEFERQLTAHPGWDKRSASLKVTDASAARSRSGWR